MNPIDRDKLDQFCEQLVGQINMENLFPKLLDYGVYHFDDANIPDWNKNLMDREVIRDIYLTIKTRGPNAFKNLVLSLRHSGHERLADILEGEGGNANYNSNNSIYNSNKVPNNDNGNPNNPHLHPPPPPPRRDEASRVNFPTDDFYRNLQITEEPLKIHVRKATKFLDTPDTNHIASYPMRSIPRGLVLIIANILYQGDEPRAAAWYDEMNLKNLYEQMGFEVTPRLNLTGDMLRKELKEFAQSEKFRYVDSCFVIITAHGNHDEESNQTEICGIDCYQKGYKKVLQSEIEQYFSSSHCPHLAGKPKVFVYQTCRGKQEQSSVVRPRSCRDTVTTNPATNEQSATNYSEALIRDVADTLVVHSTLPGYVAFRDRVTGSWFIQILCEVFMNYSWNYHLVDLFNMVDSRLATVRTKDLKCQTAVVTNKGFNKHMYLNPGLYPAAVPPKD